MANEFVHLWHFVQIWQPNMLWSCGWGILSLLKYVKGTPWDDINSGILFCIIIKQCMPQIMISIFSKTFFYQLFYESTFNPNKLFVHLKDGWMLSQHWVTCWCLYTAQRWQIIGAAGESPHVLTCRHKLTAAAFMCPRVGFDPTICNGGYLWYKVLY